MIFISLERGKTEHSVNRSN